MQQNPFDSQNEPVLGERLRSRNVGSLIKTVGIVPSVPDLSQRNVARQEEDFSAFRDIASQQESFSNQLAHTVVLFPKAQRVQTSEEGIFVPKSLFGRDARLRFRQERRIGGELQVVVYATPLQNQATTRQRAETLDCSLELQWLDTHGEEYAGLWIALEGDHLLASGSNGREVYEEAIAQGATRPFLVQVETPDELPFGGW